MKKMLKGFTLVEIMIVVAIIAILANLKQIQAAVEQAKMGGVTTPGWTDIIGTDKFIKVTPTCPAVGSVSYTLPTGDTDNPTCSGGSSDYPHALPTATN